MFLLVPVILLFLSSTAILFLQQFKKGYGYSWILSIAVSFIVWILFLIMRWVPPSPLDPVLWNSIGSQDLFLSVRLDLISWPYAFSLSGLLVATIFTSSVRQEERTGFWPWSGSLAITASGLLAVLAGNPLTLVLAWTAIDLLEMGMSVLNYSDKELVQRNLLNFAVRIIGSIFLLFALLRGQTEGVVVSWENIPVQSGGFILLAVVLRLGVFPFHLQTSGEVNLRRGVGTLLKLISPASSLVLLARLPFQSIPEGWLPVLITLTCIALIYSVSMWMVSPDEIIGRPFWIISMASIAISTLLRGYPASSISWGIALLLVGGSFMLFTARNSKILFIPLLACFGLSGISFTPTASGWSGLVYPNFNFFSLILILAHLFLLIGFLRFIFRDGETFEGFERWVKVVYPAGLLVLVITHWITGVLGWPGSFTSGVWWVGWISVLLILFYFLLGRRLLMDENRKAVILNWQNVFLKNLGRPLLRFLELNWLNRLISLIFRALGGILQFISSILEGNGGVLWALLFLALMVSIISSGGA